MARFPTPAAMLKALTVTCAAICICTGLQHSTSSELKQLSAANTEFGFNLYHKVIEKKDLENILFSPWSVSQALAMTYAGASGNTKSQMEEVLKFKDIEDVHRLFRDLTEDVFKQPSDAYTLKQANKLYGVTRFSFKKIFLSTLKNMYHSPLEQKNFSLNPDQSRVQINDWVKQQTEGKIQDLLPQGSINSDTVLVLVNALYLKAKWNTSFPSESVTTRTFYVRQMPGSKEQQVEIPMMVHEAIRVKYWHNTKAKYQILELPYTDNRLSLFIVLPDERFGIDHIMKYFTVDILEDLLQMKEELVEIHLPKFKIRVNLMLKSALQQLGMRDAFSDAADFSDMTDDAVKLQQVYHQAFIDVNEEGTEAAAATGGAVGPVSFSVQFIVDHPFLFFIRENSTGSILFIGKINSPKMES